jgi:ribosome silencing factor RsfS/YbeB/iojap
MALGTPVQVITTDAPRVSPALTLEQKLQVIRDCLHDGQAEEIVTIDLQRKSALTDAMVIATGGSQRQLNALADRLEQVLRPYGQRLLMEGRHTSDWVLVDAGDVIVHLFRAEMRRFYNLEKMWGA